MVVRHTGPVNIGTPVTKDSSNSTIDDYTKTLMLYPISLSRSISYISNIICTIFILIPQLIVAEALVLLIDRKYDGFTIFKNVLFRLVVIVIFSISIGYFSRYLLDKLDDTTKSSYVYVAALSIIHIPFFLTLKGLIPFLSFIAFLLNASLAMYISQTTLLKDHQFIDNRAGFIYNFVLYLCYAIFLGIAMMSPF